MNLISKSSCHGEWFVMKLLKLKLMITKSYLTNTNNNTVVLQYGFHLAYYTVYMIVERLCIGRCFAYM